MEIDHRWSTERHLNMDLYRQWKNEQSKNGRQPLDFQPLPSHEHVATA